VTPTWSKRRTCDTVRPPVVSAQWAAERRGLARFHTEQPVYSILNRGIDRIDEIAPPGTDVGTLDQAYRPPALGNPGLRRRTRTAA
jgi:hypothetical protein